MISLIREPLLRGVREVTAFVFTPETPAEVVLAEWATGAVLERLVDAGMVLRLPNPISVRCEVGPGVPLVEIDGRLVALPLDAAQLKEVPRGAIARMHHGRLIVQEPDGTVDPSSLLDLGGWHVETPVRSLNPRSPEDGRGGGRAPHREPVLALQPEPFDSRARLGGRPEPTTGDRRRWRRLQQRDTPVPSAAARGTKPRAAGRSGSGSGGAERAAEARIASPMAEWFRRRRHRKYLDDLTRLFAAGDLDAALRLALPLGGDGGPTARGVPSAREDLRITPHRNLPSSVVPVDAGLRAELEHRYRVAFARLEAEGRVLDAAFVLADLLNRTAEACSFLERHGAIRVAAELAEARSNDHGEVVRLWWRSGERIRAVNVARRYGCFASAVVRLERTGERVQAAELRRSWMAQLLSAGDIVGAYDVSIPINDDVTHALRARLVEIGTEQDGPLRARILARQLRAHDDEPHTALAEVLSTPEAAGEREVLVVDLTARRSPVDHPQVVRLLVRRLLSEGTTVDRKVIDAAVALADDPVLRTDLPSMSDWQASAATSLDAFWIEVDGADRGPIGVRDARMLGTGQMVVALDGVGVRLVKRSGRTEAEFDLPADVLIPSDNGMRVLAIRSLGVGAVSVASIALPERRVRQLGELAATTWADTYDGANWFIGNHSQLWMLDMLAEGPTALWHQAEHRELIVAMSRAPGRLAVVSEDPRSGSLDGLGRATIVNQYRLPDLAVTGTSQEAFPQGSSLLPDGRVVAGAAADLTYRAWVEVAEPDGVTVVAQKESVEAPVAIIRMNSASRVAIRIEHGWLVVIDDRGRVEAVDLGSGVRRSLRLTI